MPPRIKDPQSLFRIYYVRQWRERAGLTLDEVVALMRRRTNSFSKATLSRIETGKQDLTMAIAEPLSECLKCEPADLITHPPQGKKPWHVSQAIATFKLARGIDEE